MRTASPNGHYGISGRIGRIGAQFRATAAVNAVGTSRRCVPEKNSGPSFRTFAQIGSVPFVSRPTQKIHREAPTTSGVAVLSGPLIFSHRARVVAAAARHKVPAIFYDAEYAESGGLVSYGASLVELHRSAAVFVDRF